MLDEMLKEVGRINGSSVSLLPLLLYQQHSAISLNQENLVQVTGKRQINTHISIPSFKVFVAKPLAICLR